MVNSIRETAMEWQSNPGWSEVPDVVMQDRCQERRERTPTKNFTIAIDFGTTFSSLAFIALEPSSQGRRIEPEHIECVGDYPDTPLDYHERFEVPTEIIYPWSSDSRSSTKANNMDSSSDSASEDSDYTSSPCGQPSNYQAEFEEMDEDDPVKIEDFIWGYGVQELLRQPDRKCKLKKHVARFKLALATSPETQEVREDLYKKFKHLKGKGSIHDPLDVIADFLQRLFQHAKRQLQALGFHEHSPVEFVLCVPAIWSNKACRTMQLAMAKAITNADLYKLPSGNVNNLFIVTEPEAAAACVLAGDNDLYTADTFVLLDAGGGTVDSVTYTIKHPWPLRLIEETAPSCALCGSSYLNENFKAHLTRRLKDEKYLEQDGMTIEAIIDSKVVDFENTTKRRLDIASPSPSDKYVIIGHLRADKMKGFRSNRLVLNQQDIDEIFIGVFDGVANVMLEQLRLARDKTPKKVLLIGGFAGSRSLRNHLEAALIKNADPAFRSVQILVAKTLPDMAVARGAVIRALRKEEGPDRTIQSSYGFRRSDPYDPDEFPEHRSVRPTEDKNDGYLYVTNTVEWLIQKDTKVHSGQKYYLPISHTFNVRSTKLVCRDKVYVIDKRGESHYKLSHEKNEGAEVAGVIVVDMTFLKTEGRIQPTRPEKPGQGRVHYVVSFELQMTVVGRDLHYAALWPDRDGEVQQREQISITAAFVPGTA